MKDVLLRVKAYIEKHEEIADAEFGKSREVQQIIDDGDMPSLYKEVCKLLESETGKK